MAIGQSFGPQFGYQTMVKQPMMSEMYPGFDEEDIKKLRAMTANIQDPTEKTQVQNELYRKVLPIVQNQKAMANRELLKNQQAYQAEQEQDPIVKSSQKAGLKIADLVDTVKTKFNLPATAPDDQILTQFLQQTKDGTNLLEKYVNEDDQEIFYVSGLKERPVEKTSAVKNIVAGALSGTTGIPRFVGENLGKGVAWIAKKLGADETKVEELLDSYIASLSEEELVKSIGADAESTGYKLLKGATTTAQVAVGGSALGKGVAGLTTKALGQAGTIAGGVARGAITGGITGAGTTQLGSLASRSELASAGETLVGTALGGVIGGTIGGIQAGKQIAGSNKLMENIAEKPTQKAKSIALQQGRLEQPKQTKLGKLFMGTKESTITPTKRIQNAETYIKSNIKNVAKDPIELHSQLKSEVSNISTKLKPELQKVKIGTLTKQKAQLTNAIKRDVLDNKTLRSFISSKELKSTQEVIKNIKEAKTLDDLREARKMLDEITPTAVKNANTLSSDVLQIRQSAWLDTRSGINDLMDKIAKKLSDANVAKDFYNMSSLYEAMGNITSKIGQTTKAIPGILSWKSLIKPIAGTVGAGIVGGTAVKFLAD